MSRVKNKNSNFKDYYHYYHYIIILQLLRSWSCLATYLQNVSYGKKKIKYITQTYNYTVKGIKNKKLYPN